MSDDPDEPSAVGYRRPPVATRFVAGRSGNPRGRPKGSKNMLTILRAELDALVTVIENGKRRRITKGQLSARQLVNKAAGGDLKAIPIVLAHVLAYDQTQATASVKDEGFSRADQLSMASVMARVQRVTPIVPSVPDVVVIDDVPDAAVPEQGDDDVHA
jgi:hypothetical protein